MKTVTIDYSTCQRKTFTIPSNGFWKDWFAVFEKNEDKYTKKDWDIFSKATIEDFIKEQTGNEAFDADVYSFD